MLAQIDFKSILGDTVMITLRSYRTTLFSLVKINARTTDKWLSVWWTKIYDGEDSFSCLLFDVIVGSVPSSLG